MNILFFHGLDSSAKTNKFTVIEKKNKFSVTVDYRKLSFHEVGLLYDKLIAKFKPDILVGHSLGGYWALKKSHEHKIPSLSINLPLDPRNHFDDYIDLKTLDFDDAVPRGFYLELKDEIIDMKKVADWLEDEYNGLYNLHTYFHGHHRVEKLENINSSLDSLIDYIDGVI